MPPILTPGTASDLGLPIFIIIDPDGGEKADESEDDDDSGKERSAGKGGAGG